MNCEERVFLSTGSRLLAIDEKNDVIWSTSRLANDSGASLPFIIVPPFYEGKEEDNVSPKSTISNEIKSEQVVVTVTPFCVVALSGSDGAELWQAGKRFAYSVFCRVCEREGLGLYVSILESVILNTFIRDYTALRLRETYHG